MISLPSSFSPVLTDSMERPSTRNSEDDSSSVDPAVAESPPPPPQQQQSAKLAGHPCAAGCGHFCWAANRDSPEDL